MHTDMYGTFSVHAWRGYGYFITFSDDYFRFEYVHRRSDTLDTLIEFKVGPIGYSYQVTSIRSR